MIIRPIRTEDDYDEALCEIDRLMGATSGSPESDKLEILVTLVERYESGRWTIETPDPISAIHHVMEARGLQQKDLAALIGSQSHASEVLRRRRPLSLAMIRALAREWSLPADVLVREYELATD
ncbi:MAG: helix-turn-helix domain-containing protein [Gemmatimonadota bacterium]|nr:helix-turn-helix domain-containing protein [Gemmatimonadota bacterium]